MNTKKIVDNFAGQHLKATEGLETREKKTLEEEYVTDTKWLQSKRWIYKNLIVISIAWMLQFTAFQSISNLQSSLNSDQGLGTASLTTIYVTLVLSCLLIPPIMIKNIGLKWTIVFSQLTYLIYIGANMYPRWYTLLPGDRYEFWVKFQFSGPSLNLKFLKFFSKIDNIL